ncbi:MAG TPA: MerR family transcriptional regulator [Streptosporangiaceae bacterium]|jgi:hypothetical protein|nr:MerR family transcriptional regulator [Streptosporangiaceae bacterium]
MQARPPEMMENEVEVKVATTPDSSLPSVGPPSTTAIWTDEIRLRNSSGTEACKVARRLGLRASAIRYYEQRGLLNPVARRAGRRWYGPAQIRRLASSSTGRKPPDEPGGDQ